MAAEWVAIGVAGRLQTSGHAAITGRYENYNDRRGFITGTRQTLQIATVTGEYKWTDGLLARLEFRRDFSDKFYFERGTGGASKHRNTLTLGMVAYFGPK